MSLINKTSDKENGSSKKQVSIWAKVIFYWNEMVIFSSCPAIFAEDSTLSITSRIVLVIIFALLGYLVWRTFKYYKRDDGINLFFNDFNKKYYYRIQWILFFTIFFLCLFVEGKSPSYQKRYSNTTESQTKSLSGGDKVPADIAESIRAYIQQNGYSCDKIREALVMNLKQGYLVLCQSDSGAYRYEVYDQGGNWIVRAK